MVNHEKSEACIILISFFFNGQVGELFETYVDAPGLSINKPHQSAAARGTSDSVHGESAVAFPGGYRHVACSSVGPDASLVCVKRQLSGFLTKVLS